MHDYIGMSFCMLCKHLLMMCTDAKDMYSVIRLIIENVFAKLMFKDNGCH